ncbi:MAG: hypothetical protein LBH65_06150, partial [Desulfovibrio sp.]|nr:hypothetical protein [Desulfovibrio sp.]
LAAKQEQAGFARRKRTVSSVKETLIFRFGVVAAAFSKGGRTTEVQPPFEKALRLAKTKNSASRVLPTLHELDIKSVVPWSISHIKRSARICPRILAAKQEQAGSARRL